MFKNAHIKVFIALILVFAFALTVNAQEGSAFGPEGNQIRILPLSDHGNTFIHVTSAGNVTSSVTYVDHPLLNGNPDAIMFVTPRYIGSILYAHIGVWYSYEHSMWTIFTQDHTAMPVGVSFFVQVLAKSESVMQVTLDSVPEVGDFAYMIDHPMANNNPLAMIQVMPTWTVDGNDTGVYYDTSVALDYAVFDGEGRWYIYDTNYPTVPDGAGFNIQITNTASRDVSFIQKRTDSEIYFDGTNIMHPLLVGNPNAQFVVTQIYNMYEASGSQFDSPIMVVYNAPYWGIARTDFTAMPVNTQFLVTVLRTTSLGDANTVSNDGFEVKSFGGTPTAWNVKGIAVQKCNNGQKGKIFAYEQYCAGQVKGGNGATSAFVQNVGDVSSMTTGNNIYFGARVFGKNNAGPVKAMVKMTLANGSVIKVKLPSAELQGSYYYKPVSTSTVAPLAANVTDAKVKIQHKGTGKLIVDAVYLSVMNLTHIAVEAPDTLPLPLPAAPDAN